jgi:hypothetical protein
MDKRSNTSADNGRLGGRPKAPHTIATEALKKFIIEKVTAEKEPIINALIAKAKDGDVPAIRELYDRALGKATQPVSMDEDMFEGIQIIIKQKNDN